MQDQVIPEYSYLEISDNITKEIKAQVEGTVKRKKLEPGDTVECKFTLDLSLEVPNKNSPPLKLNVTYEEK